MTAKELIKRILDSNTDLDQEIQIHIRCQAEEMRKFDTETGEEIDDYFEITDIEEDAYGDGLYIRIADIEY